MASAVDSRLAYARLSAVATASRLPTANRGSNNSYTTSWDTTNTRHLLTGLLRQSVFGRLAGYEDVNDAERLSRDPAMRAIVDRKGLDRRAASTSQMGRFETEWLATDDNLAALTALSGFWIDRVHDCQRRSKISPPGRSKTSPLNVMRYAVLGGCPGSP